MFRFRSWKKIRVKRVKSGERENRQRKDSRRVKICRFPISGIYVRGVALARGFRKCACCEQYPLVEVAERERRGSKARLVGGWEQVILTFFFSNTRRVAFLRSRSFIADTNALSSGLAVVRGSCWLPRCVGRGEQTPNRNPRQQTQGRKEHHKRTQKRDRCDAPTIRNMR